MKGEEGKKWLFAGTKDRRVRDGARRDVVSGLLRQPGGFKPESEGKD